MTDEPLMPGVIDPMTISLRDPSTGDLRTLNSLQAEAVRRALEHHRRCRSAAARSLGIGRSTLYRLLAEMHQSTAGEAA